ncbi:hypothetical protein NL676_018854 [Syzygium grande]|nr:hypothetical protein NL676_018854 [Syzygium grande]
MKKKPSLVLNLAELAKPEGLPAQAVAGLEALEAVMVVLVVAVVARVLVVVGKGGSGGGAREIGDNRLSGGLPSSFENLKQLNLLELSQNDLGGDIPSSLWNLENLQWLGLGSFNINGSFDLNDIFKLKNLTHLDLSFDNISFTKSVINAATSKLAYLFLDSCNLTEFPRFIGYLSKLEMLRLSHNKIRGTIPRWMWNNSKESLNFSGELPSKLLKSCRAMKFINGQDKLAYLSLLQWLDPSDILVSASMTYAMTIMSKGTKREYAKIPDVFMAIDFSNNKFGGFIPELIGDLKSLRVLNLSNNFLNGSIPPSLANLTVLESLDLSGNHLVGKIPQQLAHLTFLSVFNISHNRLSGPIPRGTQFDTFGSGSFAMNDGLCGSPLPNKCTNDDNTPPPPSSFIVDNEEECLFNLGWRIVLIGVGVGFLVGVVLENVIIDKKRRWFLHYSKKMAKGWKR